MHEPVGIRRVEDVAPAGDLRTSQRGSRSDTEVSVDRNNPQIPLGPAALRCSTSNAEWLGEGRVWLFAESADAFGDHEDGCHKSCGCLHAHEDLRPGGKRHGVGWAEGG